MTILGAPLPAVAQPTSAEPVLNVVEVRVGAIIANNSGQWTDQRVTAMNPRFHTLFPYSSYRLLGEERQWVPWGGRVRLDISSTRYVVVVPRELKNQRVSMRVRLMDGERAVVDTLLSLKDHGTFLVGGPPETDGVLILAIGASTTR
jgi:hypothetical protein